MKKIIIEMKDEVSVSDGYHTMDELYEHRIVLFLALCRRITMTAKDSENTNIWRSKLHHDESSFEGWFILGIGKDWGKQINYHLPLSYWDQTNELAETLDFAPEWDGHTSSDVLERLKSL